MKSWQKVALLGGAALVAYYFLSKKQAASSQPQDAVSGAIGGAITGLQNQVASGINDLVSGPMQAAQGVLTSQPAVSVGGAASQFLNAPSYMNFGPGAASALANVDYINTVMRSNIINANVLPTASGSGVIQFTGASGVPKATAQAYIDTAIRASSSQYGVSLSSGGANVFNITSQGTAATTSNKPTATNPLPSSYGSLSIKSSSTPTASLASLAARGL